MGEMNLDMIEAMKGLDDKARTIKELRDKVKAIEQTKKDASAELDLKEDEFIKILQESNNDNFSSSVGKLYLSNRTSYKVPADPEAKMMFFDFLKKEGIYDEVISVNSAKLNSLAKEYHEVAAKNNDPFFRVPGLGEPTIMTTLNFRKT